MLQWSHMNSAAFPLAVELTLLPQAGFHRAAEVLSPIFRKYSPIVDYSADERLAAFLVGLSQRHSARGYSATRFHLTMSRTDIANYLRLATETVSRVLKRFQQDGLIAVARREIEIRQLQRLNHLARCVLQR